MRLFEILFTADIANAAIGVRKFAYGVFCSVLGTVIDDNKFEHLRLEIGRQGCFEKMGSVIGRYHDRNAWFKHELLP
jgi:hypothetical protein